MQLAQHLLNEFEIDGHEIRLKEDLKFKYKSKEYTIPRKAIQITGFKSKNYPDLVIRCGKKVYHNFILGLAETLNLQLKDYIVVKEPVPENDFHGYATITCTDGEKETFGDGEVHIETLRGDMKYYPHTFLRKRTEDRAILRHLGLYQLELYSEAESFGQAEETSLHNYDDRPRRNLPTDSLTSEIQKLVVELKLNKEELSDIVHEILNIPEDEKIKLRDLNIPQKNEIKKELENRKELLDAFDISEDDDEISIDEMKVAIKEHKIKQEWDLMKFREEAGKALDKQIDEIKIKEFTNNDITKLYNTWINS